MEPFNPNYKAVWKVMTPSERRATARFDIVVAVVVIALMSILAWV